MHSVPTRCGEQHGVLSSSADCRPEIVPEPPPRNCRGSLRSPRLPPVEHSLHRLHASRRRDGAERSSDLLARTFEVDGFACPSCGSRMTPQGSGPTRADRPDAPRRPHSIRTGASRSGARRRVGPWGPPARAPRTGPSGDGWVRLRLNPGQVNRPGGGKRSRTGAIHSSQTASTVLQETHRRAGILGKWPSFRLSPFTASKVWWAGRPSGTDPLESLGLSLSAEAMVDRTRSAVRL
jgi:hypothetical protein